MKKIDLHNVPLKREDNELIERIVNSASKKVSDGNKLLFLRKTLENTAKVVNSIRLTNAPVVSADVDTSLKGLLMVAYTKFYVGSLIDRIATVAPMQKMKDTVFLVDFVYKDAHAPEGITAGTHLVNKRSRTYANKTELQRAKAVGVQVREVDLEAKVRALEQSYTLEAYIQMLSTFGKLDDVNDKWINAISAKLKDEVEFNIIDELSNNVSPDATFNFCSDATDCPSLECVAKKLVNAIEDVAERLYMKHGIYPNVVIIGSKARKIMNYLDNHVFIKENNANYSVGINILGTVVNKFTIIYDPYLNDDIIITYRYPEFDVAPVVYGVFVPLAVSDLIITPELEHIRVVYTADAVKVINNNSIAKIKLFEDCSAAGVTFDW